MIITTVRNVLTALGVFGAIISAAAGFTVLLASLFGVGGRKENPIDTQFRVACSQVNGKAVWNGKHWECLK